MFTMAVTQRDTVVLDLPAVSGRVVTRQLMLAGPSTRLAFMANLLFSSNFLYFFLNQIF